MVRQRSSPVGVRLPCYGPEGFAIPSQKARPELLLLRRGRGERHRYLIQMESGLLPDLFEAGGHILSPEDSSEQRGTEIDLKADGIIESGPLVVLKKGAGEVHGPRRRMLLTPARTKKAVHVEEIAFDGPVSDGGEFLSHELRRSDDGELEVLRGEQDRSVPCHRFHQRRAVEEVQVDLQTVTGARRVRVSPEERDSGVRPASVTSYSRSARAPFTRRTTRSRD